jgi:plastocyanin
VRGRGVLRRGLVLAAGVLVALFAVPAVASATMHTQTYRLPITVAGYEVKQAVWAAQRPPAGSVITRMSADVVNADGSQVPIQRLMLHHIVFLNLGHTDPTCADQGIMFWDNETLSAPFERFYAAGEERAQMVLPPGYAYFPDSGRPAGQANPWGVLYMVMNHEAQTDSAFIQWTVTYDDDPSGYTPVDPYWLDVVNCSGDPIYNVPGTGNKGSSFTRSRDFTIQEDGRIVAGGGHVHGGARKLTVTEPDCDNRQIAKSIPTWGLPSHPFYHVRPILHEPGPINMSGFNSSEGIPVTKGETLRLNSIYEDSRPHVRVMGIMMVYVAPDPQVTAPCGALPDDIQTFPQKGELDGRHGPVPFKIPLTGLDKQGNAITIDHPPGKIQKVRSGATIKVGDRFFSKTNVSIPRGGTLNWKFDSTDLHNVTLANGPAAIGSPNLSRSTVAPTVGEPREFSKRFTKAGTYRIFCALHPVQMSERVVVRK